MLVICTVCKLNTGQAKNVCYSDHFSIEVSIIQILVYWAHTNRSNLEDLICVYKIVQLTVLPKSTIWGTSKSWPFITQTFSIEGLDFLTPLHSY